MKFVALGAEIFPSNIAVLFPLTFVLSVKDDEVKLAVTGAGVERIADEEEPEPKAKTGGDDFTFKEFDDDKDGVVVPLNLNPPALLTEEVGEVSSLAVLVESPN